MINKKVSPLFFLISSFSPIYRQDVYKRQDNCSTDQTQAEILRAMNTLSTSQRTIRLLLCPTPGKANALNAGLAEIDTRYFVTVDADTSLSEQALHIIVQRIITSGAGCVAGNLLVQQAQTWVQKMQIYDYLISIAAVKRYQGSYGAVSYTHLTTE